MARYDQDAFVAHAQSMLNAEPDPSGNADLVGEKGSIVVASKPEDFKKAFKRLKKVPGYRWIVIHREDLFLANTLSLGTKAGIIDEDGKVLKAADVPRK